MKSQSATTGEYALTTGEGAVRRLWALHRIYSPAGRRVLLRAGLKPGMNVADFGCGVGATTHMLAEMVGPSGPVTGLESVPLTWSRRARSANGRASLMRRSQRQARRRVACRVTRSTWYIAGSCWFI